MKLHQLLIATALTAATASCTSKTSEDTTTTTQTTTATQPGDSLQQKLDMYNSFKLTADMSKMTEK